MEENAWVEHTLSTVLVGHLVDGDVIDSCFEVTQGTWQPW
jgi:ACT domain-containing protein